MKLEIEIDDTTGKPVGALDAAAEKFRQSVFNEGFGKGASKSAAEAQAQIEKAIADAKAGNDPLAKAKIDTLEKDAARLREEIAKRDGDWKAQLDARKDLEALELKGRDEKITALTADVEKRAAKLADLAGSEIKATALKFGAHENVVEDVAALLKDQIGLDADLNWFVKDQKDSAKVRLGADGKPVTIEGLVEKFLTDKPQFKASGAVRGAGAVGGRSLVTPRSAGGSLAALGDAFEANPGDRKAKTAFIDGILAEAKP